MTEGERKAIQEVRHRLDDVVKDLSEVKERMEDVENTQEAVSRIPEVVAEKIGEVKGSVTTLTELVNDRADKTDGKIEVAGKWDKVFKFATAFILPIVLAAITAYGLIHSAGH